MDSFSAWLYAKDIDKCPRDDTRNAACKDFKYAYKYAYEVDECPMDDTRKAVCKDPEWACGYVMYIDKEFHEDTWEVVKGTKYEEEYNRCINQIEKDKII